MTDDTTAPATKQDIAMLMEEFGKIWMWKEDVDQWRTNMDQWKVDFERKLDVWKQELKEHFDLVAENIRYDFRAANREEIEVLKDRSKDHGKRIGALEQVVGITA